MTFHEERQLNFMTLQAWKVKFFHFLTFQVFHDLYKRCEYFSLTCMNLPVLLRMIAWLTENFTGFHTEVNPFCVL